MLDDDRERRPTIHFRMNNMFCIRPRSQFHFNDTSKWSLPLGDVSIRLTSPQINAPENYS